MFYCQSCAIERQWPDGLYLPRSRGPCEMCDKEANCFDVPSGLLPDPSEQQAINSIKQTIEKRSL